MHTRRRFEPTHGDVLSVPSRATQTTHTTDTTHHTLHTNTSTNTTHNDTAQHTTTPKHKTHIPHTLSAHTPHRTHQHTHTNTHISTHTTLHAHITTTTHTLHTLHTHHTHTNAWLCACQTTDRDLESSSTMKSKSVITVISCGHYVFGINNFCKIYFCNFPLAESVLGLINDFHE